MKPSGFTVGSLLRMCEERCALRKAWQRGKEEGGRTEFAAAKSARSGSGYLSKLGTRSPSVAAEGGEANRRSSPFLGGALL